MTGIFLSLSRVLPDRYPLGDDVENYIAAEHGFGISWTSASSSPDSTRSTSGPPTSCGYPRCASCWTAPFRDTPGIPPTT